MRTTVNSTLDRFPEPPKRAPASAADLKPLLEGLHAQDKDIQVLAARRLALIPRDDVPIVARLTELLAGSDQRARWGAAYALSLIDGALDLRSLPALIEALHTPDGDVRWAAAGLMVRLGRLYPEQIQTRLLDLIGREDPAGRKMALYCLRDLDAEESVTIAAVRLACDAGDSQVLLAVLALVKHLLAKPGDGRYAPELIALALTIFEHDRDGGVRRAAAHVLGSVSHPPDSVRQALARAANLSPDRALRKIALQMLDRAS